VTPQLRTLASPLLAADDVARGVSRLLIAEGFSPLSEFTLGNGRRLDVAALGRKGEILGVEIKVSTADLKGDGKWPDYLGYCDAFYFAVPPQFPAQLCPEHAGLIIADSYGGAITRRSALQPVAPARRRALTLRFVQCAAERLARFRDPNYSNT
jgi:hypothetical protein